MAATRVGTRTTGGATSTSFATTFGQTPTAGNLLKMTVASSKGTPEPTIGLSGAVGATWTLLGKSWGTHGAAGGGLYLYAKFATSSETAPTITASGTSTVSWVMEEWAGVDPSYMPPFAAWAATIVASASTQVLSASRTSTVDNEWVVGVLGGRGVASGVLPPSAYGGGLAANYNTQVARTAYVYSSTATIATAGTTLSGSVTFINNDSTDSNTFALTAFRLKINTGTAAGGFDFAGSAVGKRPTKGVANGSTLFAGTAQGVAPILPKVGAAAGSWNVQGDASGRRSTSGAAAGAWNVGGSSVGAKSSRGVAAGAWSISGGAAGKRPASGSATGGWVAQGMATGRAARGGTATGLWAVAGSANGQSSGGTAAGSWTLVGTAAGAVTPRVGVAAGDLGFAGTASGVTPRGGAAGGGWELEGQAAGRITRFGAATGSWLYAGVAAGSSDGYTIPRDPIVLITSRAFVATITSHQAAASLRPNNVKADLT